MKPLFASRRDPRLPIGRIARRYMPERHIWRTDALLSAQPARLHADAVEVEASSSSGSCHRDAQPAGDIHSGPLDDFDSITRCGLSVFVLRASFQVFAGICPDGLGRFERIKAENCLSIRPSHVGWRAPRNAVSRWYLYAFFLRPLRVNDRDPPVTSASRCRGQQRHDGLDVFGCDGEAGRTVCALSLRASQDNRVLASSGPCRRPHGFGPIAPSGRAWRGKPLCHVREGGRAAGRASYRPGHARIRAG
ncbi:hypothetical protein Micbo1qcDRAFT_51176 [Microdochium bolleyi]|uniref:Uncharacterized protein n=1 Tax=Microdochium bolleyi TaxID=196109 RepID=A0A136J6Q1_9PEZI|nr:hypothetical protein Micbo1qcDRAFT_51176 [Microdochium bolleyi]